jgi:hypothetical protein
MTRKYILSVVAMIAIIAMVISGCTTPAPEPPPPGPEPRTTGPFLDEVLITREPSTSAAIQQLKTDAIDLYAFGLADAALFQEVVTDSRLKYTQSLGNLQRVHLQPSRARPSREPAS